MRLHGSLKLQSDLIMLIRKVGLASGYSPNHMLPVQMAPNNLASHPLAMGQPGPDHQGLFPALLALVCPPALDAPHSLLNVPSTGFYVLRGAIPTARGTKQKQKQEGTVWELLQQLCKLSNAQIFSYLRLSRRIRKKNRFNRFFQWVPSQDNIQVFPAVENYSKTQLPPKKPDHHNHLRTLSRIISFKNKLWSYLNDYPINRLGNSLWSITDPKKELNILMIPPALRK